MRSWVTKWNIINLIFQIFKFKLLNYPSRIVYSSSILITDGIEASNVCCMTRGNYLLARKLTSTNFHVLFHTKDWQIRRYPTGGPKISPFSFRRHLEKGTRLKGHKIVVLNGVRVQCSCSFHTKTNKNFLRHRSKQDRTYRLVPFWRWNCCHCEQPNHHCSPPFEWSKLSLAHAFLVFEEFLY